MQAQERVLRFWKERAKQNRLVLRDAPLSLKRFWSLDGQTYREGALDKKTKELLGLVASTVLRCDDCILYHLIQCRKLGLSREEILEALNVAAIVGGSITIPHIRRAVELWDEGLTPGVLSQLKDERP